MKTITLLAAVLLATAIADTIATKLDEPSSALARGPLGRKIAAEEGNYGDASTLGEIVVDINTLRTTFGLIGEDIKHVDEPTTESSCMTQQRCDKNKVVYSKKCTDSAGNVVGALHSAAKKCIVRFKKCVPNC